MRRFSKSDIETIKHLAARGFGGVEIAAKLNRTPQAVRVKCCELGIRLRPMPTKDRLRILFEPALYCALAKHAKARGTTPARLARLLLVTLLSDNLMDAVLDVPVGKGAPIKREQPKRAVAKRMKPVPVRQPSLDMALLLSPQLSARIG